ncbi:4-hydroxy-tetrahydrodipicolinate synthase [Verrucomicrobium sp. GAS474]|uniref:4-hydroxy-tetrahydrodipicolinate synthase n=1 Tax=Verrucomicrobium sp. GAS474 TaxID=1882831 RepID=UPI00087D127B|nr:4-hydroxy-tetrahydrodipicolinate synthase [Verrucomicrobium sp. GAS474]SDU09513.1 4-hydroxy-tetrahydrodipicolinate synthase [Verrucomicrobium sp. GAS474]
MSLSPAASVIQGAYTALVTPFQTGGDKVDEVALTALIEAQIAGGITGIVPVGTTGESPTLDYDEHLRVIELSVQVAKGRCQVVAGTGSNSTKEAVYLSREAERLGADSLLLVAPYYNKPTQEGLYQHFLKIAGAVSIPIILYSIPGRCGIEIAVETVARLAAAAPNIVAIKEAGGSVDRVTQLRQALPASFAILSGDDGLTLPFLSVGAVGVISVASNVVPKEVADLVSLFASGKTAEAEALHRRLTPLFRDLFVETNPVPTKFALARRGAMTEEVRLPLVPLSAAGREKVGKTLDALGL